MKDKTKTSLAPYITNLLSLISSIPWLLFIGIFTIPSMLGELINPPPVSFGFNPMLIEYTFNILMVTAIQLVPLLGLLVAGWTLFSPQAIRSHETNVFASHVLWIKSCVPLVGLFLAQLNYGQDIISALAAQPIQVTFYLVSPLIAVLALLLGMREAKKQVTQSLETT